MKNILDKKTIIFLVLIFTNGCSSVGLTVSSDVDDKLTQDEWTSVNTSRVQKEIK